MTHTLRMKSDLKREQKVIIQVEKGDLIDNDIQNVNASHLIGCQL